jgi:type 2 lantibiotic biosynthesis protein LanM
MNAQSMASEQPQKLTWTDILRRAVSHQRPLKFNSDSESHRYDPSGCLDDELRKAWIASLDSEEPDRLRQRLLWADIDSSVIAPLVRKSREYEQSQITTDPILKNLSDAIREMTGQPLSSQGLAGVDVIGTEQLAFIDLWAPAAEWALRELRASVKDHLQFKIGTSIWEELAGRLLSRMCHIAEMTLWEKFNEERSPGITLLAYLGENGDGAGLPTREYYTRFIQRHRSEGIESLLAEFPVLGRLLSTVTALWLDSSAEMLQRIEADRAELSRIFDIPLNSSLEHIQQGLSDPHCGGRSVTILTFGGAGESHRVVYKPKDISVDAAYQNIISYLNSTCDLPTLKSLRVLQYKEYGYMNFVPHRVCSNASELAQFYHNAGRLTAILYVLGCTDCHHENLIANGDQLFLIDGETLFEADFENLADQFMSAPSDSPVDEIKRHIDDSVLRSGLLPMWQYYGQDKFATDLSALGIAPPNKPVEDVSGWLGLNSDGMMPGIIESRCEIPTSLPVGVGESNPLHLHLDTFCDGFKVQCEVLIRHRLALLGDSGLLNPFQGLQRRIIKRATWIYYAIQDQLLAPDALRSELSQGMRLEQLGRAFLLDNKRPKDWPVFEAEMRQMEILDIPFFVYPIDGSDMGEMGSILGLIKKNSLEACRKRLQTLDTDCVKFQLRLIRGAIQARVLRADQRNSAVSSAGFMQGDLTDTLTKPGISPKLEGLSLDDRLLVGQTIANQLIDLAFHDDVGRCEWLGMNIGWGGLKYYFGPVGPSLYSGSTGIALFLACLKHAQKLPRELNSRLAIDTIIREIIQPLVKLTEMEEGVLMRWWRDQPLGIAGCGGVLLALITLDRLAMKAPDGFESYTALANKLTQGLRRDRLDTDKELDLLQGVTGLIGPLLMLGEANSLEWARIAGDRLIDQQKESGGWIVPSAQAKRPLTGWAHGAAGMAAALAQLHHYTRERHYLQAAEQGLEYERQLFVAEVGNWPDFRSTQESPYFHVGWCNGAPGIALSRLCLMGTSLWNRQAEEELDIAIATTANSSVRRDHLCCGRFGLVAILRMAAERIGASDLQATEAAQRIEQQALAESQAASGNFHLLGTGEGSMIEPGLMTGISGIGMVLLNERSSLITLHTVLSGGLLPVCSHTYQEQRPNQANRSAHHI